jgi:hypothetical protein
MADEAVDFVNSKVGSLDELGMTGGASKFHPPSQLAQMLSMGKRHILINDVPLKILNLVAPLLEAARIAYLRMGPARPLSGDEISQRYLSIHPLPPQMVDKTRLIMTFRACNMPMAGGSPRIHVGVHLVTHTAKGWTL